MVADPLFRRRFDVSGIVQGVGFRPFVYALAHEHGLSGWVENNETGVSIEVQGHARALHAFGAELVDRAPPLARIEGIDITDLPIVEAAAPFVIVPSHATTTATAFVSPDVATCADCLVELADPTDRRFAYPFTNCTNCGPRYSIVTNIPYDRPSTTMATFELCAECRREYEDPTDRRFHAQPVCCPRCGPRLSDTITHVVASLQRGEIVALKGLGGYHLTALASDDGAVARLRARKHREDKPFAVMVPTVEDAERCCQVSAAERALLTSIERPIVLLERRADSGISEAVAPSTVELGIMLPYTPLHHLLLGGLGEPMVCTSANVSDEPIAYRDDDARKRLSGIADVFLTHNRPIHIRVDDSVVRVVDAEPYPIRRSRGYAPAPIRVPWAAPRPILACGAELKNTIAYARGRHVFLSHHIGDLKTVETYSAFQEAIEHLGRLFEITPEVIAHDLHPQYLSTTYANECEGIDRVGVQHHHAHVAACMADAGHDGPVIGVAFDGMGYGDDDTIWGGEFLIAELDTYTRAGWFTPVPMPGGDAATRAPWRMALSYLDAGELAESNRLDVADRNPQWAQMLQICRAGTNTPMTSSVGRLFDAVASLLGVRDLVNYEGQAAIELEQLAHVGEPGSYAAGISSRDGTHQVSGVDLVAAALDDLRSGVEAPRIAMRFHRGLGRAVVEMCERIRSDSEVNVVALTGGVFLNVVLLREASEGLRAAGFDVLRHRQVPCNDGGISFGQAVVAAARDRLTLDV